MSVVAREAASFPPRRLVRRRVARGRRSRPLLWCVGAALALAVLLAGGEAGRRHAAAVAAARLAARQLAAGDYRDAWSGYARAALLWPWLPVAAERARAAALVASSAAYRRGLADLSAGRDAAAERDLERVLPADAHYPAARRQLAALRQAGADAAAARAAAAAAARFARDASAFWTAYRAAMGALVPAWEQFGFGNAAPYVQDAAGPLQQLPARAAAAMQDAAALAAVAAQPGAAADTADLRAAVQADEAAGAAAARIAVLAQSALDAMRGTDLLRANQEVPADISGADAQAVAFRVSGAEGAASARRFAARATAAARLLLGGRGDLAGLAPAAAGGAPASRSCAP